MAAHRLHMRNAHPQWSDRELDLLEWLIEQTEIMEKADEVFTRPDPRLGYIDAFERNSAYAELVVFILHHARSRTPYEAASLMPRIE